MGKINIGVSGGLVFSGPLQGYGAIPGENPPAAQSLSGNGATLGTIGPTTFFVRTTANGAARTGAILTAPTYQMNGQIIVVSNEDSTAANSITMAAVATSHVAAGVAVIIGGGSCMAFIALNGLWYDLGGGN